MIAKLTKKLKREKQNSYFEKAYNFEKTSGFAGVCPDCGGIVEFRMYFQEFNCTNKNCAFVANINGERVWDNKKRDENLKRLQEESDYKIKNGLDI